MVFKGIFPDDIPECGLLASAQRLLWVYGGDDLLALRHKGTTEVSDFYSGTGSTTWSSSRFYQLG